MGIGQRLGEAKERPVGRVWSPRRGGFGRWGGPERAGAVAWGGWSRPSDQLVARPPPETLVKLGVGAR